MCAYFFSICKSIFSHFKHHNGCKINCTYKKHFPACTVTWISHTSLLGYFHWCCCVWWCECMRVVTVVNMLVLSSSFDWVDHLSISWAPHSASFLVWHLSPFTILLFIYATQMYNKGFVFLLGKYKVLTHSKMLLSKLGKYKDTLCFQKNCCQSIFILFLWGLQCIQRVRNRFKNPSLCNALED